MPLTVSGFTPRTVGELADELSPDRVSSRCRRAAAVKPGPPAAGHVEPGSAIGVELVRGDMSTVATGTVTYVDGSDVLAFGHPLFGIGEVYLPHGRRRDPRLSPQPLAVVQDVVAAERGRHAGAGSPVCIIGDLDARTTMLPIDVRVTGPGVEPRLFHAEVARNRRLTPMLASMVVGNAIADAEPDVTDMIVTVTSKVGVKGYAPLELRDQIFSPEGVSSHALAVVARAARDGRPAVQPVRAGRARSPGRRRARRVPARRGRDRRRGAARRRTCTPATPSTCA